MRRTVTYTWHLPELMARAGMHNSTDLLPHLKERGIDLSSSQVYRLVVGRPERVSLQFLAALCDIFDCGFEDLVTFTATANVVDLATTKRPTRARVTRDEQ